MSIFLQTGGDRPRNPPQTSSGKKTVRGSPKASNARELIERRASLNYSHDPSARSATLPKKINLFAKKDNHHNRKTSSTTKASSASSPDTGHRPAVSSR